MRPRKPTTSGRRTLFQAAGALARDPLTIFSAQILTKLFMHIVLLGAFFSVLLFVATTSVAVLAGESDLALAWWSSLFPLAYSHGMAGFLVLCRDLRAYGRWRAGLISATISGGSTALSVAATGWLAFKVGPFIPQGIALVVLVMSSLAGIFGLALAIRLWPDGLTSKSTDEPEATSPPVIHVSPLRERKCG